MTGNNVERRKPISKIIIWTMIVQMFVLQCVPGYFMTAAAAEAAKKADKKSDKKVVKKSLRFVLLDRLGHSVVTSDYDADRLQQVLEAAD